MPPGGTGMENSITRLTAPAGRDMLRSLNAGDRVTLSGDILVFRDQVHRILCGYIDEGRDLPFSLEDAILYYCGPTPPREGMAIGSAGPTTSSRMDTFTAPLLDRGLAATIGKGDRSPEMTELFVRHGAVYFVATGGAGALLGRTVTRVETLAFPELGPEAARMFTVVDMPLTVGIDTRGNSAFATPEQ